MDEDKPKKEEYSRITPSSLDPMLDNEDWDPQDIRAIVAAAEDQDITLKKLNEAYDLMWFALLNNEDWDNDDDHPFHEACGWIQLWRMEKYPHIWPPKTTEEGEDA